jgi:cytochrome c-type biogenesis protein CcmH/NrfG
MPIWKEWRTTVWQRSLGIVVHRECAVEADRTNDGKKVSSNPPRPNLWKNRRKPIEKKKKKKKRRNYVWFIVKHIKLIIVPCSSYTIIGNRSVNHS